MKLVLLLGLCALALAKIPSHQWEQEHYPSIQLEERAFKRGNEYQFSYNGQVATGIPGSSPQHAATRIQALVSLVLKGEDKALLQIQQVRMGKLNQQLFTPRAMTPFMAFQEVEMEPEALKELKLPVMFNYQQGVVSELVFDGEERAWSANIKKGIINMLQVNLAKKNQIKLSQEAHLLSRLPEQESMDFFATQEKTVEGECETLYTVVSDPEPRNPQQVLNVTRSIEFENCKQRPEIKYNFRFQDPCESCEPKYDEDQKFLKSSSIAKFNISGTPEQFVIESATVESQYQVVPFNRQGNVISTYVNQTLVLLRSGKVQNQIRQPKNPKQSDSDLVYTLDWDKEMEEFLMKGHNQARLPVDVKDRVKIISEILRPLVSEMRECVSEQAPIEYSRLIKMLRFTEKSQLPQIFQHFFHQQPESFSQEESLKIKAILTDALADAGTKDTVSFLLELIKEQKISPLRAAMTIKQLNNIRTPSKEIVREFLSFLEEPVVQKNFVLKQAAYLTLGSIVQGLCMPSEERLAILPRPSSDKMPKRLGPNTHLCPQQLQEELVQKMMEMVERSSEEQFEEAVLALKSLGNMGIPKAVLKLEKVIKSDEKEYPQILRNEAILALRQLRETLPQKIQQILMPIFMSRQENNEIRMAAVHMIFETQPSRPVLDQIARKMFAERSHQVASFVYTYMATLANSTNPCEKKFARDLQLSLRHGRVIGKAFLPHYSKYLHASGYSHKLRLGADISLTSVISNRTFVPRYLGSAVHVSALGFWSKYLAEVGIYQENIEQLFSRVLRRTDFDDLSLQDILERNPRGQQSPVKELKKLWKQLETVARRMPGSPKALANLKLKDQEFFMLPISQKSIESLPSLKQIKQMLEDGSHFNLHKAAQLHEVHYKIPTTIGMPVVASVRIPTVSQISGQVRVEMQNPLKIHINNVKPSAAISIITTVNVWNPVVASGLKVVANAKICAPITAKVQIDAKTQQPSVRIAVQPEEKEIEWVKVETRPMTFTRVYRFPLTAYPKAQYKTILGEQWNRVNNVRDYQIVRKTEQVFEKVTGMQVRAEGIWHHTPMNAPKNLPFCPFSGPNHFVIRTRPTQQLPKEFVLKVSAQMEKDQQLRSQPFQMEEQEDIKMEQFESSKGYQATIKTELYTKGSSQERKAELETSVSVSPALRILKSQMELTIQPIEQVLPRTIKVCSQGSIQYPQGAQRLSELTGKAVVGQLKATWGQEQCKEQNKVEIRLAARHSQQQQKEWEQEPRWQSIKEEQCQEQPERCSPLELSQPLRRAQQLLRYTLQAKFQNISPVVKNVTNGLFQALKNYYYWNTNQINFNLENPENMIFAEATIDSKTRQVFNMTVKTPVENVTFTDAELPMPVLAPVSIRQMPEMEEVNDVFEQIITPVLPVCRINSRRVRTFDDVAFRAPLSNCWTVLAKDCDNEENPAFAVLVKNLDQQSQQKALKIVTRKHTVQIQPESQQYDSLKVKINGKEVPEQRLPENQQVQIQKWGQQMKVILQEAGVRVKFDGYSAEVQISPVVSGSQCGLCGHYDMDAQDEFRNPQMEQVQDIRRFIQSYTLKEGQCQFPQQLEQIASSSEEMDYQPQWEQEERYMDSEEQEQKRESWEQDWEQETVEQFRPVRRILTEEEGRKICFSSQPVPRCPRDSFAQQYEQEEQQVQFRCISRSHPEAHRFLRIARQQSQIPQEMKEELEQAPLAYTSSYSIPKQCRREY